MLMMKKVCREGFSRIVVDGSSLVSVTYGVLSVQLTVPVQNSIVYSRP